MSSVPVLEAVPMQDTINIQDIQTFNDDHGRNYSYMFNFEQVRISAGIGHEHSPCRSLNIPWFVCGWRRTGALSVPGQVVYTCS